MKNLDQFRATFPTTQQRMDKLVPRIEEARNRLSALTPEEIVERSGCTLDADGRYRLDFMGRAYVVNQSFVVRRADTGDETAAFNQSIILMYLATADGTSPFGHWISFHELPDGQFYEQAFRAYSGEELVRDLQGDVEAFRRAATQLHGEPIELGDAAFVFRILPRLRLAVVMYAGDEDFPAQARVLFEATAPHYLSTDGLAILGGQLVGQIVKAAKSMTDTPAILTQGLIKSYGSIRALRGVDLEVRRGEIFGFLGPNGSGKTTTIRCLLDLIRPEAGTLRVLGLDPQRDSLSVRMRVGYLPGELRVDDSFTVEATFKFFGNLRGGTLDWNTVRDLAERFSLELQLPVKNLSKGNKQKVGVVQALMHRPELLMLDEPTSGLDPLMQREVLNAIRAAREAGATVFFSSHVLSEVEAIADRVGIIRRGEVVEIADTQALIERAVRRVHVRFKQPIDLTAITTLPGVTLISHDDTHCQLHVAGEMDRLIKTLATYPVGDLEIERTSLEEIFLAYYDEAQP